MTILFVNCDIYRHMISVSELYIYPIKSLGGIKIDSAEVTDRGFKYDRRWMLIDSNNRFISQREYSQMALLNTAIDKYRLTVFSPDNTSVNIPLVTTYQDIIKVTVWDDTCDAVLIDKYIDAWFSDQLKENVRLVFMPNETQRSTDPQYTDPGKITSFSDAYPFMMIGQASLDDLNQKLNQQLPINRFRPNIVFSGGIPYQEDKMDNFTIGDISFNGVKLCARCNVITIDQATAQSAKEPTKTLASYRAKNNKIYFGQNLVHTGTGIITVGDEICLHTEHFEERFII